MKINIFQFGAYQSYTDCGLYIEKRPAPSVLVRDVTRTHVPGRDGDIIQDNGCYKNAELSYKVGCADIDGNLPSIKKMLGQTGYNKLYDTYDAGYYRIAAVTEAVEFEEELLNFGRATIKFTAEPYRYSILGLVPKSVSVISEERTALENDSDIESKPLIYLEAAEGTTCKIMIGDLSWLFQMPAGCSSVYIDCKNMYCYKGSQNLTGGWLSDDFPELLPGRNKIKVLYATSAKFTPNWRYR